MPEMRRRLRGALLAGAAGLLGAALWLLATADRGAVGPEPVPYDHVPCARCRMLVSEPRFAAQLRTDAGDVLYFDDPGCLLLWRGEHPEAGGRAWFHHHREEAWIPEDVVAFVRVPEPTPMGYGFGAVRRGEDGDALPPAEVTRLLERRERGGGGP